MVNLKQGNFLIQFVFYKDLWAVKEKKRNGIPEIV